MCICAVVGVSLAGCADRSPERVSPSTYAAPETTNVGRSTERSTFRLTDVTRRAGIDFVHENGAFGKKWMPETVGSGGGFLDYDGDGWPDLLLVNGTWWSGHEEGRPPPTPHLYRNLRNGRFRDVTAASGLDFTQYGMGAVFADYDADGDMDMYLTAVGADRLLRNDGGRFADVTAAAGDLAREAARGTAGWSTGAAWLDTDRDGWLDLFVCHYVRWSPETDLYTTLDGKTKAYATPQPYDGDSCRLYHNRDGSGFVDVSERAGVLNPHGKSLGVAVADFDRDGWPDIVVTNDTEPNFLYHNDGDGTFTEIGLPAGVAYDARGRARAGMGVSVADLAGDGRLSIAIGNFAREPMSLYTQIRPDLFQDRAGVAGLASATLLPLTFGVLFADLDLDGAFDLVEANGHIEPGINAVQREITFAQPPRLFHNDGRGRFTDWSGLVGEDFAMPMVARGVAAADIDRDGDLDLLFTVNGGRPRLFRTDVEGTPNWIRLRFEGLPPNLGGIGAEVTLRAGGRIQRARVTTGSSYLTQSETETMTLGLGSARRVDSLEVLWPTSGRRSVLGPLEAGREITVRERDAGEANVKERGAHAR